MTFPSELTLQPQGFITSELDYVQYINLNHFEPVAGVKATKGFGLTIANNRFYYETYNCQYCQGYVNIQKAGDNSSVWDYISSYRQAIFGAFAWTTGIPNICSQCYDDCHNGCFNERNV